MKLVHYSAEPIGPLRVIEQNRDAARDTLKPRGLWVSDDDCEDNWVSWCTSENYRLGNLACPHDVELVSGANVLVLASAPEIDAFTKRWVIYPYPEMHSGINMWIDWSGVREVYQGMIITPYVWERRLSMGDAPNAMWYYSWDCASGCIWDPAAIGSIVARERK